ncbi:HAD-IA family hydrolase [Mycobacterium sp. SM1]|uniref:HAD-IA family hydrolase n=1 Tax=Mycobacterium sp. SM1 TaxID=2816243 RepID=UPI001BD04638|nr:HAD-IA family hydrolase [Mycobacterium sp. SM1]MBS4730363.1 HAD-IA family hydrolase [Mycobacterium sp. SM1]
MTMRALVLDFGGPVLLTPFEVVRGFERRLGVAPGTFDWTGPFDPARDSLWRRMLAGEIREQEYWAARAEEVAAVTGRPGVRAMMAQLYPVDVVDSLIRRQARETVRAAKAAGLRTAVLTNDLASYFGDEWIGRVTFLNEVDVVIDCSRTGVLKPDPAAYRPVLDALAIPAGLALFVDDQPGNTDAARALGMPTLLFDVTRPATSYREVIQSLRLHELDQV